VASSNTRDTKENQFSKKLKMWTGIDLAINFKTKQSGTFYLKFLTGPKVISLHLLDFKLFTTNQNFRQSIFILDFRFLL